MRGAAFHAFQSVFSCPAHPFRLFDLFLGHGFLSNRASFIHQALFPDAEHQAPHPGIELLRDVLHAYHAHNLALVERRHPVGKLEVRHPAIALEDIEDPVIQAIKRATRRFVRQQGNWFRVDDPRIRWIDAGEDLLPEAVEIVRGFLAGQHG